MTVESASNIQWNVWSAQRYENFELNVFENEPEHCQWHETGSKKKESSPCSKQPITILHTTIHMSVLDQIAPFVFEIDSGETVGKTVV